MSSGTGASGKAYQDRGESSSFATLLQPHLSGENVQEDDDRLEALHSLDPSLEVGDSSNRLSFKRRKRSRGFSLFSLFQPSPSNVPPRDDTASGSHSHLLNSFGVSRSSFDGSPPKDVIVDWVAEGPGRRVYDDLTAIDWIYEYTKERLRVRALAKQSGLFTGVKIIYDASQVWLVLMGTGVAVGLIAAAIDIATNWLGDFKDGFCRPTFYLSRNFCCWGLDASHECKDWVSWGQALGLTSKGGAYIVKYIFYSIYSVLFATAASALVTTYALYARHSGIPEIKTILGGFVIRRFMGVWTLVIKSLGLCLTVASGLWLGKEGPLVHVACCCANLLMKLFEPIRKNEARKREILSAAAAAGISVAFGSPIGGVLFSLEQLSYYFPDKTMWQSFVTAMVAAVTLQFMNPFRTGKLVMYQVKYTRSWHGFEMAPFCILGVLGGLYGALFIKLNMWIAEWRKNYMLRFYPTLEVAVVGIVTAVINYPIIFMRLQSSQLVSYLFQECTPGNDFLGVCQTGKEAGPIVLLIFSAVLGIILASVTFGLQIPAGIILPSMAIGSLYGRAMGMVVQAWQRNHPKAWLFSACQPDVECVTPGMFAIIGAASALGGVTRMTVSIVVIMFELTGALTYVLPIMVAVMISKWVGDAFGKRGIYESWINFKEYPYLENRDDPVPDISVADIMTRIEDLLVITATGHTINSLEHLLRSQPYKGFPVVADTREAILLGYISRSELRYALDQARHIRSLPGMTECFFGNAQYGAEPDQFVDLRHWMDQTPITLSERTNLQLAMNLFQKLGLRYILFARHGQLQGLMTRKDAVSVMNNEAHGILRDGPYGSGLLAEDVDDIEDVRSATSSDPLTGL